MARAERILIVGGGIGGLSVAAALHTCDFAPELIEHRHAWRTTGGGIAMQPNGMRVLRTLGVGTAVERAGTVIRFWDFCDDQGEVLSETDLTALWGDVGPFVGIARRELQRALLAGAGAVPSRLGTSISSLTQDTDHVSVGFGDERPRRTIWSSVPMASNPTCVRLRSTGRHPSTADRWSGGASHRFGHVD
jgi:2-polyprenyl-6-methoxyphenol hydroxylase-like FAD-dependent oxidoreductase